MQASRYDIPPVMYTNTWNGLELEFLDTTDGGSVPIDLTGAFIQMQIRQAFGSTVLLKGVDNAEIGGIIIKGGTIDTIVVEPFYADWGIGTFWYDVRISFDPLGDDVIKTYIQGTFIVKPVVTR